MYFRQTLCLPALIFFSLVLGGCSRERPHPRLVAALPFEDDSADGVTDGFGAAAPHLLQWQLDGEPDSYIFSAANADYAAEEHADRMLLGWYRRGNRGLEAHITLQDAGRNRTAAQGVFRGDAASVLNGIARFISPSARALASGEDAAILSLGRALAASGSGQAHLVQAELTSEPPFVPAVLFFSRALLDGGQKPQAAQLLARARPAFAAASPLDRARYEAMTAAATRDSQAELRALNDVVRLAPADPDARRKAADLQFNARQFDAAAASYSALTHMRPWDGTVFNQLAYVRMYLRDKAGARDAIEEYAKTTPEQAANAADSLGEIDWYFEDYRAAEQSFLKASQGNIPLLRGNDLLKAAEARLLQGDRAGADRLFGRYASWRASTGDAQLPLRRAQWLFITGRAGEAKAALSGDVRSEALAQLSFWTLLSGNRTDAAELAGRAAASASTPEARTTALICQLYTAPTAALSQSQGGSGPERDAVMGSALVLARRYAEAVAPLSNALMATPPNSDGFVRGMLIRADLALGRKADAARLLWPMPMPFYNGDPVFDGAWFPEWLTWRKQSGK